MKLSFLGFLLLPLPLLLFLLPLCQPSLRLSFLISSSSRFSWGLSSFCKSDQRLGVDSVVNSWQKHTETRDCFSRGDDFQKSLSGPHSWSSEIICLGTKISPVWPSKSKGSSGGSGEWGTVGRTGASLLRETAVSRRSSGMWLGSGERHKQRDLLCFTIMQRA